jgi:hypothetical protein
MTKKQSGVLNPSRRGLMASGAALLNTANFLPSIGPAAQAEEEVPATKPTPGLDDYINPRSPRVVGGSTHSRVGSVNQMSWLPERPV